MTASGADILIAEDVWGEAFERLGRDHAVQRCPEAWADHDRLHELLASARALVVRNRTQVDAALLAAAPQLEVVGRAGVGLDNIDLAAADAREVVVVAPAGANAVSVAEHTVALALALARELPAHDTAVRAGRWDRRPGRELAGRTWGLLGWGATGQAVARLAAGLQMTVRACDPYAEPAAAKAAGVDLVSFGVLLETADVLSIHLPLTPQTRGLLGAQALARVQPGTMIVNVGRGEVVDE
ncbi:MAG: phosphoglycerate dehydrogenase, partial [Nocardiopsaceae bacterium]|nr:phosphoglycerate dehydrogenase [Nocardiopsaceae bacterium]